LYYDALAEYFRLFGEIKELNPISHLFSNWMEMDRKEGDIEWWTDLIHLEQSGVDLPPIGYSNSDGVERRGVFVERTMLDLVDPRYRQEV
jgi:hypothetical protein